jgi:threonylcarbamoyladenosine tRNA methylthiotransferase MtaB
MDMLQHKTFRVLALGCRTNQYESEAIAASLERAGAVHSDICPDVSVIVSCTVTAVADRKCRKLIRKLRRENPAGLIVVCGCYAQKISEEEMRLLDIDIVIGNRLKYKLPELLEDLYKNGRTGMPVAVFDKNILTEASWDDLSLDRPRMHTRAFLKVQDGCNHYCSYCIVPYVRGYPVSRDVDEAVAEARSIVLSGCPEIVLTGIHLGLHRDLPSLVRRIGSIGGLKRLRFGSIEPFAVNKELLDSLAETKAFCQHLHIPLQSGDDSVLAAMRRGYTSGAFRDIAENIRSRLGDKVHLSTDIMIGFPGEDERAFENSMNFIRDIGFGKVHVFPYSPREGTDAASLIRPPDKEVRERVHEALAIAGRMHQEYCSGWIGEKVTVLVEEKKDGTICGLTRHYVRVAADCEDADISEEAVIIPEKYTNGILVAGKPAHDLLNCAEFQDII